MTGQARWGRVAAAPLVALVGACANFGEHPQMPLNPFPQLAASGEPALPPQGLLDACADHVLDCPPSDELVNEPGGAALGATSAGTLSPAQQNHAFEALLLMRADMTPPHSVDAGGRVHIDRRLWAKLARVNADINWRIIPRSDREIYGVEEYWALPLEGRSRRGRAFGDCEDYVLEKRSRLLAMGLAPENLSIAVAFAPGLGRHAVLIVRTDRGDLVLDNLARAPQTLTQTHYLWIERQRGPGLLTWEGLAQPHRLAIAPPEAQSGDLGS